MLVCSISLRPPRSAVLAELAEAATAADAPGFGNGVFATLVDDPASVNDTVDAYLGEIMLEAANATDTVSLGITYTVGIDEEATATAVTDAALAGATTARSAVVAGRSPVSVNLDVARDGNVGGVMVNH